MFSAKSNPKVFLPLWSWGGGGILFHVFGTLNVRLRFLCVKAMKKGREQQDETFGLLPTFLALVCLVISALMLLVNLA